MIDVTHQISAVRRTVGTRVLEAGEARVITIGQHYAADVADVWDACTSAGRIGRWFLPVSGDLRVGGRYQLAGNAGGTVQRCAPPTGFAATWEYGDEVSWIELSLSTEGDGTRFELEHTAHVDDERWAEFGPGAVGVGWDLGLNGLVEHLSTGVTVDPEAAQVWAMSEDGRAFIAQSSQAWATANIAGGADEADAHAAAGRTTAFYTGGPA